MKSFRKTSGTVIILATGVALLLATAAQGQIFTSLVNFEDSNGVYPYGQLVQGVDGNFYGVTSWGGSNNGGTVFSVTSTGVLTTIYNFCSLPDCADGEEPEGLLLGTDGNLYGTTNSDGPDVTGTVFEVAPTGELKTLYSFCAQANCADGTHPGAALIEGWDGNFYGTAFSGGDMTCSRRGCGTVFKLSPLGVLTVLHTFEGSDGKGPGGPLVHASDGNFYGTTSTGGNSKGGTLFRITPMGTFTSLYNFSSGSGAENLIQGRDGALYGTTLGGGRYRWGSVFRMTLAGEYAVVYSFCQTTECEDGADPLVGLIEATDGNFYGTTSGGGVYDYCSSGYGGCGTVFQITSARQLTTLHSFDLSDGTWPYGELLQATDGNFYGTTNVGGDVTCYSPSGCGTVFSLSMGLAPFVQMLPGYGHVGKTVKILGTNLTGTTDVTFNGVAATFTVVSGTEIEATVPAGATSGTVEVTTPNGVLESNGLFHVRQ